MIQQTRSDSEKDDRKMTEGVHAREIKVSLSNKLFSIIILILTVLLGIFLMNSIRLMVVDTLSSDLVILLTYLLMICLILFGMIQTLFWARRYYTQKVRFSHEGIYIHNRTFIQNFTFQYQSIIKWEELTSLGFVLLGNKVIRIDFFYSTNLTDYFSILTENFSNNDELVNYLSDFTNVHSITHKMYYTNDRAFNYKDFSLTIKERITNAIVLTILGLPSLMIISPSSTFYTDLFTGIFFFMIISGIMEVYSFEIYLTKGSRLSRLINRLKGPPKPKREGPNYENTTTVKIPPKARIPIFRKPGAVIPQEFESVEEFANYLEETYHLLNYHNSDIKAWFGWLQQWKDEYKSGSVSSEEYIKAMNQFHFRLLDYRR